MTTKQRTVALLGLSADPAHKGHLALSESIMQLGFESVWWSITPANPFKRGRGRESYAHRHALAQLLINDGTRPWLELHDFEAGMQVLLEEVRTFTLLEKLIAMYGDIYRFNFVMGSDNWKQFHLWGQFENILNLVGLLIINRGDDINSLLTCPAAKILANKQDHGQHGPVNTGYWRLIPAFTHPASSTAIASQLAAGEKPNDITDEQFNYIHNNLLYKIKQSQ